MSHKKIIILIILIGIAVGIGYLFLSIDSNDEEIIQDMPADKIKEALNIPDGWWFSGGGAPAGSLIFRDDGILEAPSWLLDESATIELTYDYEPESELLIINFVQYLELFPKDESSAENLFGPSKAGKAEFVEYDKENLNIKLNINQETDVLEFFGWLFYRTD